MKTKRQKQKRRKASNNITVNRRVDFEPAGGNPAQLGFYTAPVKQAVARWRIKMSDEIIEHLFCKAAMHYRSGHIRFDHAVTSPPEEWLLMWDLLKAAHEIYNNRSSPVYWLLTENLSVFVNGQQDDWGTIALNIKAHGGPTFTIAALKKAAERLQILTPPEAGKNYFKSHRDAKGVNLSRRNL